MPTIYVEAGSGKVRDAVYLAVAIVAGRNVPIPGAADMSKAVAAIAGNALLRDIQHNYREKSKGLGGFDGQKWAPLLPATIEKKVAKHKRQLQGKSDAAAERRKRLEEYRKKVSLERARQRAGNPIPYKNSPRGAKGLPEHIRKEILKNRRQAIERQVANAVGHFPHEYFSNNPNVLPFSLTPILIDDAIMVASLAAGYRENKYAGPHSDQQIFEAVPGQFAVGTNVPYASKHQQGDPYKNLPQRPFLPKPGQIPVSWWTNIEDAVVGGIQSIISQLMGGSGI